MNEKQIAIIAYIRIKNCFEQIINEFPNTEFDFCWDECMWVDEEFFASIRVDPESYKGEN